MPANEYDLKPVISFFHLYIPSKISLIFSYGSRDLLAKFLFHSFRPQIHTSLVYYGISNSVLIDWTNYFAKCLTTQAEHVPCSSSESWENHCLQTGTYLVSPASSKLPLCICLHHNLLVRPTQVWLRLPTVLLRNEEKQRLQSELKNKSRFIFSNKAG